MDQRESTASAADWLVGGGRMGALIRSADWTQTPLGPRAAWPQSLRIAVNVCLNSRFPMFVWWGSRHINLYNDSYVPMLGKRHPAALGKPAEDSWADIWHVVGPQAQAVIERGEATWNERVLLVMERHGYTEETWFTWSYSPIHDEAGAVAGLFCAVTEETGRVRAEAALRDSEQRFRAFVTASSDVVYRMSADWSEMRQLQGREFIADTDHATRSWLDKYIHADDRQLVLTAIEEAIRTKGPFRLEHRVLRVDGSLGWTSSRAVPLLDADGRILEWVGTAADITERRNAEEQLRRSNDTFYHLIQNNPFGVYVVDGDFRLRQVSRGAQKVFENVRPLLGRDFAEVLRAIWAEPFASQAIALFRHTLDTGEPYVAVGTIERRQDITEIEAYDWRIERITLPDGRFGVVCYFYDLSERQRWEAALTASEERLRTSEERLALAVGAAELGTFYCPMPLGDIIWNDKCKEHFWLPPDAAVDFELFYSILHPDDREPTRRAVERAVYDRDPYDIEYRTIAPDGRQRWVRAMGRAYHDEAGNPMRFDGVTLDVTDRRRVEDELRQLAAERQQLLDAERTARSDAERASRMKDEFLATLSHELRTPLNAILGWSQILSAGPSDDEDLRQGLETIARNARAQTQIIEDLLDMSRIISGKVRLDVGRVDLGSVVRAAVETVRPAAAAKGVALDVSLDGEGATVSGDASRLQQVFWNLLSNAVKFTPRDGRVRVRLDRVDSHLEASVADTGEGIRPEFLPHVFDRFTQADASTTRRHGGLGLGLAIVKQLAELHGGSIRADSAGPGLGATFTVSLPPAALHTAPGAVAPAQDRTEPAPSFKPELCRDLAGIKVLVVDDEPDARAVVRRLLEDCRAEVTTAGSADEALELFAARRPDVLVSDIGMPGTDGYTLIRRVRALGQAEGADVPAVALTAYARAEDRVRAVVAGFQQHVAKPVEPAELIAVVASLARQGK